MRLTGTRALVTGASRGLGRGIAVALAAEGASVTIVAEDTRELLEARAALAATGANANAVCVDLGDRSQLLDFCRVLETGVEAPDVLVNNAAVLHRQTVEETSDADWEETMAVNLAAPFLLMRALAGRLAERGGSVVNVSSRAGVTGFDEEAAYCAAKFGIEGLTRAIAVEWRDRPVSVNTITPGVRIKPTGVTAAEFASWGGEQQARYEDPATLGPAFVLLATLRGSPTGCRFDAGRLVRAIRQEGFEETAERLVSLAETVDGMVR